MIQKGDWPQLEWCLSNSCDPKHWTILLPKMYSAEQNRRSRKLQKRKGCKETHKICINFTHLFSTLRWIKSNVQCYYNMLQLLMKHSCQKQQQGFKSFLSCANTCIYYTHFEITYGPCNLIGSNWCDLFTNCTIFCFKSHLFPSQWGGYTKNKTTNQTSRLV